MTQNSDSNVDNGQDSTSAGDAEKVIKMEGAAVEVAPNAEAAIDWKSKAAYLAAEMDNMRKRFARERQEVLKFSNEEMIKNFLPVWDCLELALKAAKDAEAKIDQSTAENPLLQSLIKGLDMTLKVFEQTLESSGCTPVKGVGETFDPTQHEALGQSQDLNLGDNKVSGVMQRGFSLAGRVIRTAKVMVNKVTN